MEDVFAQDKIFSHVDKLYNWINGSPETLVTVEIDFTNSCNSACPACAGGRSTGASLTKEQVFKAIDQIVDIKAKALTITGGGEPLLMPYAAEALKYAHRKGLNIGLITNGIKIDLPTVEAIVKYCTWCRVSLDAGNHDIYKQVHGLDGRVFANVVGNTYQLVMAKKRLKSDCTIGTAYLTGKDTVDGIWEFATLSKGLGVDYAQLRPFHNDHTDISKELAKAKTLETESFKVLALTHKYDKFGETKRPYNKCYGCHFITAITADYDLSLCCHTRGHKEYTLGNLNDNSLREIWSSERRRKIVDSVDVHKCVPRCRADTQNRILWNIKRKKTHEAFL